MSLTKQSLHAGLWSLLKNGGSEVIGIMVFIILGRFYLTEIEFGVMAMANIFIMGAHVLVRQGLNTAIIQFPDLTDAHKNVAFWVGFVVAIIISFMVIIISAYFSDLINNYEIISVIQFLTISVIITSLGLIHEALLSRELKFKALANRALVSSATGGVAALIVAANNGGVWSLVVLNIVTSIVGTILLWLQCAWRPKFKFDVKRLRELMPVSVNVGAMGVVVYANQFIDQLVIGSVLGVATLGYYFVARRIIQSLLKVVTQSINNVVLPSFSMLKGDLLRAGRGLYKAFSISSALTFPVFTGLFFTSELVIEVLFGSEWKPSAPLLSILCVGGAMQSLSYFAGPVCIAINRSKISLRMLSIGVAAQLLFVFVGVEFGVQGVAMATSAKAIFIMFLWFFVLSKIIDMKLFDLVRSIVPALISATLMVLAMIAVNQMGSENLNLMLNLIAQWLVGGIIYILSFFYFGTDTIRAVIHNAPRND